MSLDLESEEGGEGMAIYLRGQSTCALCGETIAAPSDLTSFPAFLPEGHSLWNYSDANFHTACLVAWPKGARLRALHDLYQEIMSRRPRGATEAERESWLREAFEDFPMD